MGKAASFDIRKMASWLIFIIGVMFLLIYLKGFFKPLIFSIVIWFLIRQLRNTIEKVKNYGIWCPRIFANTVSFVIVVLAIYFISLMLVVNIEAFVRDFDQYSANINNTLQEIEAVTGFDVLNPSTTFQGEATQKLLTSMAGSLSTFVGKFALVAIYVIFMMLESPHTSRKMDILLNQYSDNQSFSTVSSQIDALFKNYVAIKIFTSFLTGILSFIVLILIGVQLAAFWAFLIFLLNFIPSVGSLIATAFPSLFYVLQSGSVSGFFYVLAGVGLIQVFVGNFIEPKIMGDKLNLSPLAVIISLVFWGLIWGVIGMLLSVPLLAMQMIVFSQFKETRPIAVILSRTGHILS